MARLPFSLFKPGACLMSATKLGNCAFLHVRRYLMAKMQYLKVRIERQRVLLYKCVLLNAWNIISRYFYAACILL